MFRFQIKPSLVFVLLASAFLLGCGPKRVHTVKIEGEANQIIDVLGENGLRANKTAIGEGDRKTFDIMVENDDQVAWAIQIMEDNCLGRPEPPQPEGGPVITSLEIERQQEQRRMKMNIETQLRQLPGVTCVVVNFVPPQDRALAINPYAATASVSINYKTPTFSIPREEIANAVARSVPDLKPENVSVILAPKPLRAPPDNGTAYNVARIAMVSGIGLATVIAFVSVVFILRKKRRPDAPEEVAIAEVPPPADPALLDDQYDFDDEDDDDELTGKP